MDDAVELGCWFPKGMDAPVFGRGVEVAGWEVPGERKRGRGREGKGKGKGKRKGDIEGEGEGGGVRLGRESMGYREGSYF